MPIRIKPEAPRKGAMTTGKTEEQQKKELERQQQMRRKTGATAPMEPISKKKGGKMPMATKGGKKVPAFAADGVGKMKKGGKAGEFADMPRDLSTPPVRSTKIKSGDTLSAIAKSYGTTVKKLMEMNPSIKNANMIRAGQSVNVPGHHRLAGTGNPYKGMSSKEITSGTMEKRSSGEKAAAKPATRKKPASKPRATSTVDSPIAAKKGGAMKKYKSGGMTCRGMGAAKKGGKYSRNG